MRRLLILVAMLLLVLFASVSCQGYGKPAPAPAPSPAPTAAGSSVTISNFAFSPASITVPAGTKVTWTNKDSPTHTVSAKDGTFDSGNLSTGATFSYTFSQKGTFEYGCKLHPSMSGKVIVE